MSTYAGAAPIFLLLALTNGLLGCVVGGDAILWVQGNVVDEHRAPYVDCAAELYGQPGDLIDQRSIRTQGDQASSRWRIQPKPGSNFIEGFVFAGYLRPASITLSCAGSNQSFEARISEIRTTPDNPLDLGLIVLVRNE